MDERRASSRLHLSWGIARRFGEVIGGWGTKKPREWSHEAQIRQE